MRRFRRRPLLGLDCSVEADRKREECRGGHQRAEYEERRRPRDGSAEQESGRHRARVAAGADDAGARRLTTFQSKNRTRRDRDGENVARLSLFRQFREIPATDGPRKLSLAGMLPATRSASYDFFVAVQQMA